jgi:hypothetical protein
MLWWLFWWTARGREQSQIARDPQYRAELDRLFAERQSGLSRSEYRTARREALEAARSRYKVRQRERFDEYWTPERRAEAERKTDH